MSERFLKKDGSDAHWCSTCKTQLAQTSCQDAVEVPSTTEFREWKSSEPRYGCQQHPVKPFVILLDGRKMSFEEYVAQ